MSADLTLRASDAILLGLSAAVAAEEEPEDYVELASSVTEEELELSYQAAILWLIGCTARRAGHSTQDELALLRAELLHQVATDLEEKERDSRGKEQ